MFCRKYYATAENVRNFIDVSLVSCKHVFLGQRMLWIVRCLSILLLDVLKTYIHIYARGWSGENKNLCILSRGHTTHTHAITTLLDVLNIGRCHRPKIDSVICGNR